MIKLFPPIVKEFLAALGKGYTYAIRKNHYVVFGILWGLPIPVVTISMGIYFNHLPVSLGNIIAHILSYPIHLLFLLHPLLFGIVFGAMGTVREEKENARLAFENSLLLANEELKGVNKKLQELDELKDNFLSIVSHELLTPLTTIQGYITFLKEDKAKSLIEEHVEELGIIEDEADHLKNLIEELMDLSKIEAGKFEVKPVPADMRDVVKKVKMIFEPSLKTNRIILEDRLPASIPLVLADANRITQVFSNLLNNAIKFTPSGGRVRLSALVADEKITFCVEDTGIGIPKDKINRIFDKFYQVDSTTRRRFGGSGLGLAITKSIIELHKGRIWVESAEGAGSSFCFELPRYRGAHHAARGQVETGSGAMQCL